MSILQQLHDQGRETLDAAAQARADKEQQALDTARKQLRQVFPEDVWTELGLDPAQATYASSRRYDIATPEAEIEVEGFPGTVKVAFAGREVTLFVGRVETQLQHPRTIGELHYRRSDEDTPITQESLHETNVARLALALAEAVEKAKFRAEVEAHEQYVARYKDFRRAIDYAKTLERLEAVENDLAGDTQLAQKDRDTLLSKVRDREQKLHEEDERRRAYNAQIVTDATQAIAAAKDYVALRDQKAKNQRAWAHRHMERLKEMGVWPVLLYTVRYLPAGDVTVRVACDYEDAHDLIETVTSLDAPLFPVGAALRVVRGGQVHERIIGAYLDYEPFAVEMPSIEDYDWEVSYHRHYRAGAYTVHVPAGVDYDPTEDKPADVPSFRDYLLKHGLTAWKDTVRWEVDGESPDDLAAMQPEDFIKS